MRENKREGERGVGERSSGARDQPTAVARVLVAVLLWSSVGGDRKREGKRWRWITEEDENFEEMEVGVVIFGEREGCYGGG